VYYFINRACFTKSSLYVTVGITGDNSLLKKLKAYLDTSVLNFLEADDALLYQIKKPLMLFI
jgi:hypothetical protein